MALSMNTADSCVDREPISDVEFADAYLAVTCSEVETDLDSDDDDDLDSDDDDDLQDSDDDDEPVCSPTQVGSAAAGSARDLAQNQPGVSGTSGHVPHAAVGCTRITRMRAHTHMHACAHRPCSEVQEVQHNIVLQAYGREHLGLV